MGSFFDQYADVSQIQPLSAVAAANLAMASARAFDVIRTTAATEQAAVLDLTTRKVALEAASMGLTRQVVTLLHAYDTSLTDGTPAAEAFDLVPAASTDARSVAMLSALKAPFGKTEKASFMEWLASVESKVSTMMDVSAAQLRDIQVRFLSAQDALCKNTSLENMAGLMVETVPADSLGEMALKLSNALESFQTLSPDRLIIDPDYTKSLAENRAGFMESHGSALGLVATTKGYLQQYRNEGAIGMDYEEREALVSDLGYDQEVATALLQASAECVDKAMALASNPAEILESLQILRLAVEALDDEFDFAPLRMEASSHLIHIASILDGSVHNALSVLGAVEAICG